MVHPGEKELLLRIKKDPKEFSIVYDENYHAVFAYIFRRLGNYELARDMAAETFLNAFRKIGSFEWRNIPISSWLFRIASNEINLYFRKSKYTPVCIRDAGLYDSLRYDPGVETEKEALEKLIHENEEFNSIRNQLLKLDVKYQEVISLRYFEKKSINEISTILNKKEGTVKSLLSRGIKKLKDAVEKELEINATKY